MAFKLNISDKSGKTYKMESESDVFLEKELHQKINGSEINSDLAGYELEITGASNNAGFASHESLPGFSLKKLLLTYGKGLHKRPRREGKKKRSNFTPKGLRMRRTVRGRVLSADIAQINLKVLRHGAKALSEIFPDQAQGKAKKENRAAKRAKGKTEQKKE